MALVSIAEAAKLVNRDRKTLYRAIREGRLTATVNATGNATHATGARQVETSELIRVFGKLAPQASCGATVAMPQDATPTATHATTDFEAKIAALAAENAQLKERLADKEKHLEDLRNTVRLLEHTPKKRSWWPWTW